MRKKASEHECKELSIIKNKVWLTTYKGIYDDNGILKFFVNCNKYNKDALGFYLKMGGSIAMLDDTSEHKSYHQYYIEYKRS